MYRYKDGDQEARREVPMIPMPMTTATNNYDNRAFDSTCTSEKDIPDSNSVDATDIQPVSAAAADDEKYNNEILYEPDTMYEYLEDNQPEIPSTC